MNKHIPVLLNEALGLLDIKENGIYVDCTLGRGGHSSEILKKLKDGKLYSIDQDVDAIAESSERLKAISNNFEILEGNFKNISALLAMEDVFAVDGILYDLGVSSPQFDVDTRGFSYRFDGPLDMRMDQKNNPLTAKTVINTYAEDELSKIFWRYGDEKFSRNIARNIVKAREEHEINTTFELVDIIKSSLPQKILKQKKHPAKKVFQALRVYVNDELGALESSLYQSLSLLKPGGRIAVITFQSLEENIVKKIFKEFTYSKEDKFLSKLPISMETKKEFKLLIKKPIVSTETELEVNNRAHSAKLWGIKKMEE